jgi:hypothetical protein
MGVAGTWILFTGLFSVATGLELTHYGVAALVSGATVCIAAAAALVLAFRPSRSARTVTHIAMSLALGMRLGYFIDLFRVDWLTSPANVFVHLFLNLGLLAFVITVAIFVPTTKRNS